MILQSQWSSSYIKSWFKGCLLTTHYYSIKFRKCVDGVVLPKMKTLPCSDMSVHEAVKQFQVKLLSRGVGTGGPGGGRPPSFQKCPFSGGKMSWKVVQSAFLPQWPLINANISGKNFLGAFYDCITSPPPVANIAVKKFLVPFSF
jgi:hypothetical protein